MLCFIDDCLLDGSTKEHNMYELLYIYSTPPDDWLQIFPKHVGVSDKINWE